MHVYVCINIYMYEKISLHINFLTHLTSAFHWYCIGIYLQQPKNSSFVCNKFYSHINYSATMYDGSEQIANFTTLLFYIILYICIYKYIFFVFNKKIFSSFKKIHEIFRINFPLF